MYELTSHLTTHPHTKLYQQNHAKPYHISSLYLQLNITAISIHNATLLSCHFRKIATVSHFRLVFWMSSLRYLWHLPKNMLWFVKSSSNISTKYSLPRSQLPMIILIWWCRYCTIIILRQVVQEYERAVIFRLGRLPAGGSKGPGRSIL